MKTIGQEAAEKICKALADQDPYIIRDFAAIIDKIVAERSRGEADAKRLAVALKTILDAVDYRQNKNCRPNQMVAAVLPTELLEQADAAMKGETK